MKTSLAILLGLSSLTLAAPSINLKTLFARAEGDACKGDEGDGSCQDSSVCIGLVYDNKCPNDPAGIKCCVAISCEAPQGFGVCRRTSGKCDGGSFVPGFCPGASDIQCCVPSADDADVSTSAAPDKALSAGLDLAASDGGLSTLSIDSLSAEALTTTLASCRTTLSCTFSQIQASSMAWRLSYVRYMESTFFGRLNSGNQFRAIEGVIQFFINNNLGKPGSWISYVDTGIVEAIQNGGAIALGMSSRTGGNPGSALWADFFRKMKAGTLGNRDAHDLAWSNAEERSTNYGKTKADKVRSASLQEQLWFKSTQLFRLIMRHRNIAKTVVFPYLGFAAGAFIDWLTNITDIKPTLCFSQAVWDLVNPRTIIVVQWTFLLKILPNLIRCFRAR